MITSHGTLPNIRVPALPRLLNPPTTRPDPPAPTSPPITKRRTSTGKGPQQPFTTGWCGNTPTGTCKDTTGQCPGYVRNGSNAPRPIITCTCACHPVPSHVGP